MKYGGSEEAKYAARMELWLSYRMWNQQYRRYRTTEVRRGQEESRRISNRSCTDREKIGGMSRIGVAVQRRFDMGWMKAARNIELQLYRLL